MAMRTEGMLSGMTASAATNSRMLRHLMLMVWLACLGMTAEADTRVRVLAAPAAAVTALRALTSDVQWLPADSQDADLTLVWQADGYARSISLFPAQPVLLLAQSQTGLSLRSQDAALVWGPPLSQQVQLARQLLPGLRRIGVLHRGSQRAEVEALRQLPDIEILPRLVEAPLEARVIAELAQRSDILIASNDELLFNRDSAKLVLLTAYRHQRAWIGPTPAFVTAGALATRAVGKEALLQAIVEKVRSWQRQHRLGGSQQLAADEVVCNQQVARSLGLSPGSVAGCQGGRE